MKKQKDKNESETELFYIKGHSFEDIQNAMSMGSRTWRQIVVQRSGLRSKNLVPPHYVLFGHETETFPSKYAVSSLFDNGLITNPTDMGLLCLRDSPDRPLTLDELEEYDDMLLRQAEVYGRLRYVEGIIKATAYYEQQLKETGKPVVTHEIDYYWGSGDYNLVWTAETIAKERARIKHDDIDKIKADLEQIVESIQSKWGLNEDIAKSWAELNNLGIEGSGFLFGEINKATLPPSRKLIQLRSQKYFFPTMVEIIYPSQPPSNREVSLPRKVSFNDPALLCQVYMGNNALAELRKIDPTITSLAKDLMGKK
jgi:hypothetical protein